MPLHGERRTFTREVLDEAPEAPGVFALYKGDTVLLYGSAFGGLVTIRTCLARCASLGGEATHCAWEISIDPERRERDLLEELRNSLNEKSA